MMQLIKRRLGLLLPGVALWLGALACATVAPVVPNLEWDRSAEQEVIAYSCSGGLVPNEVRMNEIRTFRLWGDGRALWVVDAAGGSRSVLTAQFSEGEIETVLNEIVAHRFFSMADGYEPSEMIMDGGACQIRVELVDTTKSVTALTGGNPPADFGFLEAYLARGADHPGLDYVPEHGYLIATPVQDSASAADAHWPAGGIDGVRLAEARGGVPVSGEALQTAWAIVNTSIFNVVESDGQTYRLAVQVEGVTSLWPETP